jgi:hypothetical protein
VTSNEKRSESLKLYYQWHKRSDAGRTRGPNKNYTKPDLPSRVRVPKLSEAYCIRHRNVLFQSSQLVKGGYFRTIRYCPTC